MPPLVWLFENNVERKVFSLLVRLESTFAGNFELYCTAANSEPGEEMESADAILATACICRLKSAIEIYSPLSIAKQTFLAEHSLCSASVWTKCETYKAKNKLKVMVRMYSNIILTLDKQMHTLAEVLDLENFYIEGISK